MRVQLKYNGARPRFNQLLYVTSDGTVTVDEKSGGTPVAFARDVVNEGKRIIEADLPDHYAIDHGVVEVANRLADHIRRFIDDCDIIIAGDATSDQIDAVKKAFPGRSIGVRGTMALRGDISAAFLLKSKIDGDAT